MYELETAKAQLSAKEGLQLARELATLETGSDTAQTRLAVALQTVSALAQGETRISYLAEAVAVNEALLTRKPFDQERQRNAAIMEKSIAGELLNSRDADRAFTYLKRAGDLD